MNADWRDRAACVHHPIDLFFPIHWGKVEQIEQAKKVCLGCPVIAQCEAEHLYETDGVYFATTPQERQALRPGRRPLTAIAHGTMRGYKTELRRGLKPCNACTIANAAYTVERKRFLRLVAKEAS